MRPSLSSLVRWTAAPVMFLSLLGGCSSGSGGSTNTYTTSDGLAAGLANAFCTQQAACGCSTGATPDAGTTTDAGAAPDGAAPDAAVPKTTTATCPASASGSSTCAERETLAAQQQLALISTAMNEGLLTVDPNIAAACVSAYQGRTCTTAASAGVDVQAAIDDPACANLFTGYIPIGERCDMSFECAPGGFCLGQATGQKVTSINGAGVLGICFGYQEVGDPCNTTDDCDPATNLTCNPTTLLCQ